MRESTYTGVSKKKKNFIDNQRMDKSEVITYRSRLEREIKVDNGQFSVIDKKAQNVRHIMSIM